MGIGPVPAIRMVLESTGITQDEVDLFEVRISIPTSVAHLTRVQINEAFASQCLYCVKELGLDPDKVNVNGGAIAFGHPLDESTPYYYQCQL